MIGVKSPRTRGTGTRLATYLKFDRRPERALESLRRMPRGTRTAARLKAFLKLERGHQP